MGCQQSTGIRLSSFRLASCRYQELQPCAKSAIRGRLMDKYTILDVIGHGAYGIVYGASRKGGQEDIAVKFIDLAESSLDDIESEVSMMFSLEHPCLTRLHDVYFERAFVCLVLDWHKGGDLMQAMLKHWRDNGPVPITAICSLAKQMWFAIAYMHSRSCVHRDAKGDNWMLDHSDIADPYNQLYLGDFGTVVELQPGERLTEKVGAKTYWPPEMVKHDYAHKVDNWAVGINMYGLVAGQFAFKTEEDIINKPLRIPSRCPREGKELLVKVLERNETRRYEAEQALRHKFLTTAECSARLSTFSTVSDEDQASAWPPAAGPAPPRAEDRLARLAPPRVSGGILLEDDLQLDLGPCRTNAGVQLRRRELVQRLRDAQVSDSETRKGMMTLHSVTGVGFVVADTNAGRSIRYEWAPPSQANKHLRPLKDCPLLEEGGASSLVLSEPEVKKLLTDHNIDPEKFGKGKAKPFKDFLREVQTGETTLQLDASRHKCLVQVADVVLLRILAGGATGMRYLIQTNLAGGSARSSCGLPGRNKMPHENVMQTAAHLCKEMLGDCKIKFDWNNLEYFEEEEVSVSYLGIRTIYKYEILSGRLMTTDTALLAKVGIKVDEEDPKTRQYVDFRARKSKKSFAWMTESEVLNGKIKMTSMHEQDSKDASPLVFPPIGLEEDELDRFLRVSKINTSKWGTGISRSLAEFSDELSRGEATLQRAPNGGLRRVVDVVVMKLVRAYGSGDEVLLEAEETHGTSTKRFDRLPAVKRRSDEHQFRAAWRLVTHYLKINPWLVNFDPVNVRVTEDEQESLSYPGLPTLYRKRIVRGKLLLEP